MPSLLSSLLKQPTRMGEDRPRPLLDAFRNNVVNDPVRSAAEAVALSPIPIASDLADVGLTIDHLSNNPGDRTLGNYGLAAASLLPFVNGITLRHGTNRVFDAFDLDKARSGAGAAEAGLGVNLTTSDDIAKGFARGKEGRVIDVEVPDEALSHMIDFNNPISESPRGLLDALRDVGFVSVPNEVSGAQAYRLLENAAGGAEQARSLLMAKGITGIRTRPVAGRGANNFTIFDTKNTKILGR